MHHVIQAPDVLIWDNAQDVGLQVQGTLQKAQTCACLRAKLLWALAQTLEAVAGRAKVLDLLSGPKQMHPGHPQ